MSRGSRTSARVRTWRIVHACLVMWRNTRASSACSSEKMWASISSGSLNSITGGSGVLDRGVLPVKRLSSCFSDKNILFNAAEKTIPCHAQGVAFDTSSSNVSAAWRRSVFCLLRRNQSIMWTAEDRIELLDENQPKYRSVTNDAQATSL